MTQASNPITQGSLFWRLWLRALTVKRPQAALALGSLAVGAGVVSLLLNLYSGVNRKMTQDFSAYGANVVISPAQALNTESTGTAASGQGSLMNAGVLERLDSLGQRMPGVIVVPRLDVVARIEAVKGADRGSSAPVEAVAVGTDFAALLKMYCAWSVQGAGRSLAPGHCAVGAAVASRLRVGAGDVIKIRPLTAKPDPGSQAFTISDVVTTGASEDDQVFLPLAALERLAGFAVPAGHPDAGDAAEKLSLVELNLPGDSAGIRRTVESLRRDLSPLEVNPVRQIVESEGKVLGALRGLVLGLTALILAIIGLSVMATMTAIVLERRKDVAVMKSLGARDRLVMRLFLAEGAALGLAGGAAGFLLGVLVAEAVARNLFGVGLDPSWWTLPLVCLATMLLSLLATFFPVRSVRSVQPATVLKGE